MSAHRAAPIGAASGRGAGRRAYARPYAGLSANAWDGPSIAAARLSKPLAALVRGLGKAVCVLLSLIAFVSLADASTPPGTVILNNATVTYRYSGMSMTVISNTAAVTVEATRTPSEMSIWAYAPGNPLATMTKVVQGAYSTSATPAGPFANLSAPVRFGSSAPISLASPVPLVQASVYHGGDPVFVVVKDIDENNNPNALDSVVFTLIDSITGDKEMIVLTETGVNTGIFAGYIQTSYPAGYIPTSSSASSWIDGTLRVAVGSSVSLQYTDDDDPSDVQSGTLMIDPLEKVFETFGGEGVADASVTIINSSSGLPATVYGDDGMTPFSSTVITDASGGFRFPVLPAGTYHYIVNAAGYIIPTALSNSEIQGLPGAPFALTKGSRGEDFTITPGSSVVHIDIPVDPESGGLFVSKEASATSASAGDFIQYIVVVKETLGKPVLAVTLDDRLPRGFSFKRGSARVNGVNVADPAISSDGRELVFSLGSLGANASVEIKYVVEVGIAAIPGRAMNSALASGPSGAKSNLASATVNVKEVFNQSLNVVLGRIVADNCGSAEDSDNRGVPGIRLYMEDGSVVVTDSEGMYHFAGVRKGAHVVQLDTESIPDVYELANCEDIDSFAGVPHSQFVDLMGGDLWRADFYLKLRPHMKGELATYMVSALVGNTVEYRIMFEAGAELAVDNVRASVILPDGLTYVSSTSSLDGSTIADPAETDGVLNYRLGSHPAGWRGTLKLTARIDEKGPTKKLATQSVVTFDGPTQTNLRTQMMENIIERTSVVEQTNRRVRVEDDLIELRSKFDNCRTELSDENRRQLDKLADKIKGREVMYIEVTGHTDPHSLGGACKKEFGDNYNLSRARANKVVVYLKDKTGLPDSQFVVIGKASDELISINNSENRRTEVHVVTKRYEDTHTYFEDHKLEMKKDASARQSVEIIGPRYGEQVAAPEPEDDLERHFDMKLPEYTSKWLDSAEPGFEFVWPSDDYSPPIPISHVVVKHDPSAKPRLFINGEEVGGLHFDSVLKNEMDTVAVTRWRSLHLRDGDNIVEVRIEGPDGKRTISKNIHFSGLPTAGEVDEEKSKLVADGKTVPVIGVRLYDAEGHPARQGLMGEYTVEPPYRPYMPPGTMDDFTTDLRHAFVVGKDGVARIRLMPTVRSGEVIVRIPVDGGGDIELRPWLEAETREWILVGFLEGTFGFNMLSGHKEALQGTGDQEAFYSQGRGAFFAKGRVKGEWILTAAYDSAKPDGIGRSFSDTLDPNEYYTLYGDTSEQQNEAPSAKKLYVKIERAKFYALFGDYDTGLTVTSLSRYSRSLTGIKSEYRGEDFEYSAFVSETNQRFVKDEIPGDGTSGLYKLSRGNIVVNTENIFIETRDRYRPEVVLSSIPMARNADYDIDYDSGTIFFREPIMSRDSSLNPVYIVVDYESFNDFDLSYHYGGRAAVHIADDKVTLGATYIHEGTMAREADLTGVDTRVKVGNNVTVRAEAAETSRNTGVTTETGSAYSLEVDGNFSTVTANAYYREQGALFGIGQQNGSESGQRTTGASAVYGYSKNLSLTGDLYNRDSLADLSGATKTEVKAVYSRYRFNVSVGLRSAINRASDGTEEETIQTTTSATYMATSRLTLRLDHDQTLPGSDTSTVYPTRTAFRADYALSQRVTLYGIEELTYTDKVETTSTRAGMRTNPWTGAEAYTDMLREFKEAGTRVVSNFGLKQIFELNKQWALSASFDMAETIYDHTVVTPGMDDFYAVSTGATYRRDHFLWSSRAETRQGVLEDKYGLLTNVFGEPRKGFALSMGFTLLTKESDVVSDTKDLEIRFGMVFRPLVTKWMALDRLDLKYNSADGSTDSYLSRRVVNSFNLNYKLTAKLQASFIYGAKYVTQRIDSYDYSGYTDLAGLEGRYYFKRVWDFGLRYARLQSYQSGQTDYVAGFSFGRSFPKGIWVSVGYNIHGFIDRDFSRTDYTLHGMFVQLRLKFDQTSVMDAIQWLQR